MMAYGNPFVVKKPEDMPVEALAKERGQSPPL